MNDEASPEETPWLVFFGTLTALVHATNRVEAYWKFLEARYPPPPNPNEGRIIPPTIDEVIIRQLRAEDRNWITQSKSKPFEKALREFLSEEKVVAEPLFLDLEDA